MLRGTQVARARVRKAFETPETPDREGPFKETAYALEATGGHVPVAESVDPVRGGGIYA
jgi:hypothetical protein